MFDHKTDLKTKTCSRTQKAAGKHQSKPSTFLLHLFLPSEVLRWVKTFFLDLTEFEKHHFKTRTLKRFYILIIYRAYYQPSINIHGLLLFADIFYFL